VSELWPVVLLVVPEYVWSLLDVLAAVPVLDGCELAVP
jgi:hypothetical protein